MVPDGERNEAIDVMEALSKPVVANPLGSSAKEGWLKLKVKVGGGSNERRKLLHGGGPQQRRLKRR